MKKHLFIISIFVIAILMTTIIVSAKGLTNTSETISPEKTYISIKINNDDTLWEIGQEYINWDYYDISSYVNEIISINNIQNSHIYAGEKIIIPIVN